TEGIHGYGFGQDEDQGQLGAWYVMSAIGLFDVKGLTGPKPEMGIGSPLFDKIKIRLSPRYYSGKEFIIETKKNSAANQYVQTTSLNGQTLHRPFLPWEKITKGGKLLLEMGADPVDTKASY
ncbi:MAG: glycoside hydrolase family 92 protein, partial [Bacteroidota bacterium]|nr:glycoside hydrolase family 92 protein [Bacteroidota bacterium]